MLAQERKLMMTENHQSCVNNHPNEKLTTNIEKAYQKTYIVSELQMHNK